MRLVVGGRHLLALHLRRRTSGRRATAPADPHLRRRASDRRVLAPVSRGHYEIFTPAGSLLQVDSGHV